MALEIKTDENGYVVFDKQRKIELRIKHGRGDMGYAYLFSLGNQIAELWVEEKRNQNVNVSKFIKFPESLEPQRAEVIDIIKECFEFLYQYRSKKADAEFHISYSLS